ncbi:MAG TPA: glycosyltransferase [Streptosporangiaceae bacterium]|jgi:glycosyltransferase involved in cell wall biosynthesis
MRIALVAEHPGQPGADVATEPGSHAQRLSQLASALAGLGHAVTIYARKGSAALPRKSGAAPGLTVVAVPAGEPGSPRHDQRLAHLAGFSDQLARRWRQDRPDVVHAHYWTGGLAALAATRGLRVPVVQTFHSLGIAGRASGEAGAAGPDHAARVRMESLIARNVSAVLAASAAELAALAGLGVPRSAITVIPCGVDTTEFGPDGPVARRTRRRRLMTVAPLDDQRQLGPVLSALALVPGAELLVAGGPPPGELETDAGYRALRQLASQLGVAGRVSCTGQVSRSRLPALLRSADLLVHTSADEQSGMVAMQAMACGTPVITSAEGSLSDAVVDGATGAVVRPDRPAALARMIRTLLASPMLLEGYGIAAADRVRARYSWDRVGRETVAAYQGPVSSARVDAIR